MSVPVLRGAATSRTSSALMALLLLLVFVGALDQTVIASALPALLLDLHIPFANLDSAAWVVTAYLLGYVAALPVAGRIADVVGRRPVVLVALGIFAAGSLAAALAPGLLLLDLARGVQAAGGGTLLPVCLAVVGDTTALPRRGLALGLLGGAAELGAVAGPPYGALVAGHWGWRAIFLTNLPLCAALALVTLLLVPRRAAEASRPKVPLDLRGALLLAGALAAFAAATSSSGGLTAVSATMGANRLLLVPCVVLLGAFWWSERRASAPLLDPATLRRGTVGAAGAANFLLGVALIVVLIDVPVFAAAVFLPWPATTAGLLLVRFMAFLPIGALAGGVLSDRAGRAPMGALGFMLAALAFAAMARWTAQTPSWALTAALAACGLGLGLATAPISGGALGSLAATSTGTVAGLVTALRVVGMMGGLAVLTSWGITRFQDAMSRVPFPFLHLAASPRTAHQQIAAYEHAVTAATVGVFSTIFQAATAVCLIGLLVSLFLGGRPSREPDPGLGAPAPSAG